MSNLDIGGSSFDQDRPGFRLGPGLAALIGGDGPLRSEVLERFAGPLVVGDERMATLIAGHGLTEPAQAWRRAVRVLAQWLGMDGVDQENLASRGRRGGAYERHFHGLGSGEPACPRPGVAEAS